MKQISSSPAYLQRIVQGQYGYGTKLPSKRTVAEEHGVSVITVEHAYSILCDEGYLESRPRSGYYVIYRSSQMLPVSEPHGDFLPESVSLPEDSFPISVYSRTARRILSDYGERLLCRSPNPGCVELRSAISCYLARSRGMSVSPDRIVIGSGSEYLYGLVVQMLGRTRRYGVEDPCYEKILRIYRANGASCDKLKMGPEGIRSEELHRTDASVLHVTPFRSYPSGITATASKRREYLLWADQREGFLVEDDFDSEFTASMKSEDTLCSLNPDRVIYMNTFSKTVAPSVRVGYMILPERLLAAFRETVGDFSCPVPVFEQYLLAELINGGDFERHINRIRRKRRKTRSN